MADPLPVEAQPGGAAEIPREWLEEFEAAAARSLETRFRYSFIRTYRPVLDDAPYRSFDTTADYRRWCEENLPDWLGYGRPAGTDVSPVPGAPPGGKEGA